MPMSDVSKYDSFCKLERPLSSCGQVLGNSPTLQTTYEPSRGPDRPVLPIYSSLPEAPTR
ncbi:hypothetical protein D9613_008839 [Agrocybe pediades]|uniref:Uncharacterized protein n=1 Tax=Agrocybe pediades TaxID=84607 RepID=A0A8H4QT28_9AGAR|nr:hypothetical protein D9613_008839 [Agrocybe pediades]